MVEEAKHYTVDEAARMLELSPACVRQMLRAGELEGERREERIEGVLGPWRVPERAVRALQEGDPGVLRAKRRAACETEETTTQLPPGEPFADTTDTTSDLPTDGAGVDAPSEASELLSESVREVREKAEALRKELELLEGRLELVEMAEFALREGLRREKERADGLQAELESERSRWRHAESQEPQEEPQGETGYWLFKG